MSGDVSFQESGRCPTASDPAGMEAPQKFPHPARDLYIVANARCRRATRTSAKTRYFTLPITITMTIELLPRRIAENARQQHAIVAPDGQLTALHLPPGVAVTPGYMDQMPIVHDRQEPRHIHPFHQFSDRSVVSRRMTYRSDDVHPRMVSDHAVQELSYLDCRGGIAEFLR